MRISIIQFLTYSGLMSSSVFIPIFAKELNASSFFIGLVIAVFNGLLFTSSLVFGFLSDRFGRRLFLCLGLLFSSILIASHIFINDASSLLLVRAVSGFASGIYPASLVVYGFYSLNGRMGKFVGYGSLGWAFGSIIAGILQSYRFVFLTSSFLFLIAFILAKGEKRHFSQEKIESKALWGVLRRNVRLYISYFLRNLAATSVWAIFPLFLVSLGANKFFVGFAYFLNTFSQFFITQFVERHKNLLLIKTGLFTSSIVFLGYGLCPSYLYILPCQILLAFSYSTLQVGCLQELFLKNKEQSTATGILNSLLGLSSVIGPILGGLLLYYWNFKTLMFSSFIICLFAIMVIPKYCCKL